MSKKIKITIQDVRKWCGYDEYADWFAWKFPNGATLDELEAALRQCRAGEEWLSWLAWHMPFGHPGDSVKLRMSWCRNDIERLIMRRWHAEVKAGKEKA
jgi:hypothetical protein